MKGPRSVKGDADALDGKRQRRDRVDHEHFTAPTVFPILGIMAYLVLIIQIGINDIGVYAYAGVLLVIGLVLYVVNNLLRRRLDSTDSTNQPK